MEQQLIAIYARVSDADSAIDSSIPDQIREGRLFAAAQWPGASMQVFSEVESAATIVHRPELCRLLELVNEGRVKAIVVRDQDRLSRSAVEMMALHQHLTKSEVEVWLYRQGQQLKADLPHDRFTMGLFSLVSELERGLAAVRTKARMHSMRNAGQWTGGHVPKGYSLIENNGSKTLEPNEMGKSILLIFQKAAETRSLAETTRLAQSTGLWGSKQGVQHGLRNRVYLGEWSKSDGTWIKNHHRALVDEDTFNRAQTIIGLPWNPRIRTVDRIFIVQGLARCQRCNRMLVPYHVRKPNGLRIFYYECNSHDKSCPTKRLPASDFEDWLWAKLADLCLNPKLMQGAIDEYERACQSENSSELGHLRVLEEKIKEAHTKKTSIDTYLDNVLGKGIIPSTSWNEKLVDIEGQIAALKTECARIQEQIRLPQKTSADRCLRALPEILGDGIADPRRKQRVMQAIVKEIIVGETDIELVLADPTAAKTLVMNGTGVSMEWFEQPSNLAPRGRFELPTL